MQWINQYKRNIAVAGAIIILFFLMMDLNGRVSDLIRLSAKRDEIQTQVAQLTRTEIALHTQIAFATSDVAVEGWVREDKRWIREGDIPLIPLAPPNETPVPQVTPTPTPEPVENWQVWRALFFGQ